MRQINSWMHFLYCCSVGLLLWYWPGWPSGASASRISSFIRASRSLQERSDRQAGEKKNSFCLRQVQEVVTFATVKSRKCREYQRIATRPRLGKLPHSKFESAGDEEWGWLTGWRCRRWPPGPRCSGGRDPARPPPSATLLSSETDTPAWRSADAEMRLKRGQIMTLRLSEDFLGTDQAQMKVGRLGVLRYETTTRFSLH